MSVLELVPEARATLVRRRRQSPCAYLYDVLAAVVLGGARLGGGKGSILGCVLGVMFVAVAQNGLNLLGVSPFAFQMIIGAVILIAISTSNISISDFRRPRGMAR